MNILHGDMDSHRQQVLDFLRDFCPEELKAQIQSLLAVNDWASLDALMTPFYNVEQ